MQKKYEWTQEIDEALRITYSSPNGSVKRLAYELGIPRTTLSWRAAQLGIQRRNSYKKRIWTQEEDEIVMEMAGILGIKTKERLESIGYIRSLRSIYARRDILRASGHVEAIPDDYGTSDLADGFGCSIETICSWIRRGCLKAKSESKGPALYYRIKHSDLRRFVLDHTAAVCNTKPDLLWLIGIIRYK